MNNKDKKIKPISKYNKMMNYRKPGTRPFEIIGEVETLNASNNSVYIVTSKRRERRKVTRVTMEEAQVMQFIPYLYKEVKVQFIKGCVFITPLQTTP